MHTVFKRKIKKVRSVDSKLAKFQPGTYTFYLQFQCRSG